MTCLHCHKDRRIRSRGLCDACRRKPELLAVYPPMAREEVVRRSNAPSALMSLEEIDALIASQTPSMVETGKPGRP